MRKQRKQREVARERRTAQRQQDASTRSLSRREEEKLLVVVKATFTFPDGTSTGDYFIVKIPEAITYEQYRQEYFDYRRLDYPETQLSIEFLDIDEIPTDGSLPDGMSFRSAWMLGGPLA